jgi:phage gpG-like protein
MIDIRMTGDAALVARLDSFPDRMHERVVQIMTKLGIDLHAAVVANLSGIILQRRSGKLADAQTWRVDDAASEISAIVGFSTADVPYGAIQEFGGTTKAHLIEAKNAKALAFTVGGRLVFAKRTNHPGSKIPERSFLRSALRDIAPAAREEIAAAIAEELQP